MDKKQIFISEIEKAFNDIPQFTLSDDALTFFESLKICNGDGKRGKKFTDNGLIVLQFARENKDQYNNLFKSKDFEAAGIATKTASGAMRKLVSDGYFEKLGANPIVYALTEKGITVDLTEE